jgi:hypothetical protein
MAHVPLARHFACLGSACVAMLALAGTAWAQPPITGTNVSTFSESFSDESTLCQDELYTTTVDGHAVMHFTYFEDTGALHFHDFAQGQVVAVPLDGTVLATRGAFGRAIRRTSGPLSTATCS